MAELNVEPKKKSPVWWIIIIIIIILIILFFVFRGRNSGNNHMNNSTKDTTGMTHNKGTNGATTSNPNNTVAATSDWEGINDSAPAANFAEITGKDIQVNNDNKYALYSLRENILFDANKSTVEIVVKES